MLANRNIKNENYAYKYDLYKMKCTVLLLFKLITVSLVCFCYCLVKTNTPQNFFFIANNNNNNMNLFLTVICNRFFFLSFLFVKTNARNVYINLNELTLINVFDCYFWQPTDSKTLIIISKLEKKNSRNKTAWNWKMMMRIGRFVAEVIIWII